MVYNFPANMFLLIQYFNIFERMFGQRYKQFEDQIVENRFNNQLMNFIKKYTFSIYSLNINFGSRMLFIILITNNN